MKFTLLIALAACGSKSEQAPAPTPTPAPPVAAAAIAKPDAAVIAPPPWTGASLPLVPQLPCPVSLSDAYEHGLFAGCAAMPFTQLFSVCPHGECPKPCKIKFEGRKCCPVEPYFEVQNVTYDAKGRWVSSLHEGTPDQSGNLLNVKCTYDGDRIAGCQNLGDGRVFVATTASYDDKGRLASVAEDEAPPATYSYDAKGRVIEMSSGRETTTFAYDAKGRLASWDQTYKQDEQKMTYRYNANGNVSESRTSNEVTKYEYDAKKRLVHVATHNSVKDSQIIDHDVKLEYDDQDRLLKETQLDDKSEVSLFITTYTYDCH